MGWTSITGKETQIYAIPGYGTRSGDVLYQIDLRKKLHQTELLWQLLLERAGGVVSNGFFGLSGPRYPDSHF